MALTTLDNRKNYIGDGTTVSFSLPYLCYEASHVKVYLNGVLQTGGYTVSGVGSPAGVTVTFTTAPAVGVSILLYREVPYTQSTTYAVAGAFPAKTTEKDLDLLCMQNQQQAEVFGRALKIPLTSTAKNIDIPDPNDPTTHGKFLRIQDATTIDVATPLNTNFADPTLIKGDLLVRGSSSIVRLPAGPDNYTLVADSAAQTGLSYVPSARSTLTTKGDLLGRDANGLVRVPAGANGRVLIADSSQSSGVKYVDPPLIGTARFDFVSPTQVQLGRGVIPLRVGGTWQTRAITTPLVASNAGLAGDTGYYVYAYDTNGATALEFSTEGYVEESTTGVMVKATAADRTLVGLLLTVGSSQFFSRYVLSWYQRKRVVYFSPSYINVQLSSTTPIELDVSKRLYFLCWANDLVQIWLSPATVFNPTATGLAMTLQGVLDGSVVSTQVVTVASGWYANPTHMIYSGTLSESQHYVTLLGFVSQSNCRFFSDTFVTVELGH